jgi:transcription elongation factor GreA
MSTPAYYTEEGLRKLQDELHHLRTVERPHISQQIADARDKGDLSENAEYHAAKEDQGLLEARIAKMEEMLASARVVDSSQMDDSKVFIHSPLLPKARWISVWARSAWARPSAKDCWASPVARSPRW